MTIGRAAWVAVVGVGIFVLAGCGGPTGGEVHGTVSFDGVPVQDGAIKLDPADGNAANVGGNIKDGKYAVENVPVGKVKVSITGTKVVGKKKIYNTSDSPEMPISEQFIPEKFNKNTTLTFDVQAGKNEKNWELTSK